MCDIERYIKWGGAKCIRGFGERERERWFMVGGRV